MVQELVRGNNHGGAHLRSPCRIYHQTRDFSGALCGHHWRRDHTPGEAQDHAEANGANHPRIHKAHFACGGGAPVGRTVNSVTGVMVFLVRLSVTETSSLYFPGFSEPRVMMFSSVISSPCKGSLSPPRSYLSTGSFALSMVTRYCTVASAL